MKSLYLILLWCAGPLFALAQDAHSVRGFIADTSSDEKLENAVISILNAKDSTLNTFTRASKDGSFSIGHLSKGSYLLLVSYPGYADYLEDFKLDTVANTHDFKQIIMQLKSKLLEGVIVTGNRAAIRMNGDTMEYNASRFVIKPNDKVEDLLKQLPGIQVDKDGKITAQGKTVNKVLVDGEEFFGDDPTLVTRNIRSDMVDKVQLFDKKSDQATLSGIDDGILNKTINVKLKEDKKNGYFGKVEAGIGTNKFYQEQVMFNVFKNKKKFAAYGMLSNTGKPVLKYVDNVNYGISDNMVTPVNGIENNDMPAFTGRYDGTGIPRSISAGAHFENRWDKDKKSLNINYNTGALDVKGSTNTLTQNNLPSGFIKTDDNQVFNKSSSRQKIDVTYSTAFDLTSSLKVSLAGMARKNSSDVQNLTSTYKSNDTLLNRNENSITSNGNQNIVNANIFYSKKFKKPGRSITIGVTETADQNNLKGYQKSDINFYDEKGDPDSIQTIDQNKTNKTSSNLLVTDINFSELFSKTFSVWFSYNLLINNTSADRASFNASVPGKYDKIDSSLSNNYVFNQLSNQAGAIFNYKKKKVSITFGTKASYVNFKQDDQFTNDRLRRSFINWSPQVSYKYSQSSENVFKVSYYGNSIQPTLNQIQPVRQNADPLNISIGNPLLKPSFNNDFGIDYSSLKVLSSKSSYVHVDYAFRSNDIVSSSFTDSAGKTTNHFVNINDKSPSSFVAYLTTSRNIKSSKLIVGFSLSANGNTSYNYSNNILNQVRSYVFSARMGLSTYSKAYEMILSVSPDYNINQSSLQKSVNNNGAGFNVSASGMVPLPGKIELRADGTYDYTAKTRSFDEAFKRFILNASMSKAFFKEQSLKIQISGNDLLDQNTGFDRRAYNNLIIQSKNTTIQRYFLFSIIYDFNKMGGYHPLKIIIV